MPLFLPVFPPLFRPPFKVVECEKKKKLAEGEGIVVVLRFPSHLPFLCSTPRHSSGAAGKGEKKKTPERKRKGKGNEVAAFIRYLIWYLSLSELSLCLRIGEKRREKGALRRGREEEKRRGVRVLTPF